MGELPRRHLPFPERSPPPDTVTNQDLPYGSLLLL